MAQLILDNPEVIFNNSSIYLKPNSCKLKLGFETSVMPQFQGSKKQMVRSRNFETDVQEVTIELYSTAENMKTIEDLREVEISGTISGFDSNGALVNFALTDGSISNQIEPALQNEGSFEVTVKGQIVIQ